MRENQKIGVLISNLGSPSKPEKAEVKKYLKQFLWDPRVIQPLIPRWIWWLVLNGIILNTRPKKTAALYAEIWDKERNLSPLIAITEDQCRLLNQKLNSDTDHNISVEFGMRYGQPSLESSLEKLIDKEIDKLIVLPLYPQYSQTTTESTFDVVHPSLKSLGFDKSRVSLINDYYDNPLYIEALKQSVENHWQKHGKPEKLVISFHGIPKVYYEKGDYYPDQCFKTAELLTYALGLNEEEYMVCFQSRFGKLEWLKPYLDETLSSFPKQGIKNVQVICPGFSADCLETLEEIEEENKEYFLEAGGSSYSYIPALNTEDSHISLLASIIQESLKTQ